jgi:DNA-binding FadR family transcriptional regulator
VAESTVPARPAEPLPAGAPPPAEPPAGGADAVFRAVRGGNTFEETVERLLQAIKLGLVRTGDRLPAERDLAVRLGVSRMTLREAIRDLQRAGYVESRRGRFGGTFVVYRPEVAASSGEVRTIARRMGESLEDALAFRRVLEVGAVELAAARRLPAEQRGYLGRRLAECAAAPSAEYRQHDSRLHLAFAELSGSPSLAAAVADVRMRLNDLLDAIPLLQRNIRHSDAQHARIVAAILAGQPARARQAMEEHLEGTAALLRGFLG